MLRKILTYFDEQNLSYSLPEAGETVVLIGFETENIEFQCTITNDDEYKLLFLSFFPFKIPENRRNDISILLLKINYELFLGNFDIDFDDGEIRFKSSLFCEGMELSNATIHYIIETHIVVMETYVQTIQDAIKEKTDI